MWWGQHNQSGVLHFLAPHLANRRVIGGSVWPVTIFLIMSCYSFSHLPPPPPSKPFPSAMHARLPPTAEPRCAATHRRSTPPDLLYGWRQSPPNLQTLTRRLLPHTTIAALLPGAPPRWICFSTTLNLKGEGSCHQSRGTDRIEDLPHFIKKVQMMHVEEGEVHESESCVCWILAGQQNKWAESNYSFNLILIDFFMLCLIIRII
jgi:hypothetical protein